MGQSSSAVVELSCPRPRRIQQLKVPQPPRPLPLDGNLAQSASRAAPTRRHFPPCDNHPTSPRLQRPTPARLFQARLDCRPPWSLLRGYPVCSRAVRFSLVSSCIIANVYLVPARELTLDAASATRSTRSTGRPLDRTQIKKLLDSRNEREVLDGLRRVLSVGTALFLASPPVLC